MSLSYVKSLFVSDPDTIAFQGKCHDCGTDTQVICHKEDGEVSVMGGAYWREIEKDFIKCESCFEKNPALTNYMPCEVYSRVVGYMRPIKQWNAGKIAEYKERKMFEIEAKCGGGKGKGKGKGGKK